MSNVTVYEGAPAPMSVADMQGQVSLIHSVMKGVMRDGEHYGVIPGTNKPSLLKAGAEKLILTFRLVPDIEDTVVEFENGHREYRVKVRLYTQNGIFLGAGAGSCSTMEGKYRYRTGPTELTDTAVPKEYWDLRKSDPAKAQEMIGGRGFTAKKNEAGAWVIAVQGEKVEHDNPADYYNTCLKMAKKRALVDAVLTVTAASDIFTQDVEDMTETIPGAAQAAAGAQSGAASASQAQAPASSASNGSLVVEGVISDVSTKTGKGKNGDWKNYSIAINGKKYGTFDTVLGDLAMSLKGRAVVLSYKQDGKFATAISIEAAGDPSAPAASDAGGDPQGCTQDPDKCDFSTYVNDGVTCGEFGPGCKYAQRAA